MLLMCTKFIVTSGPNLMGWLASGSFGLGIGWGWLG